MSREAYHYLATLVTPREKLEFIAEQIRIVRNMVLDVVAELREEEEDW